jgi:hypothetical protein
MTSPSFFFWEQIIAKKLPKLFTFLKITSKNTWENIFFFSGRQYCFFEHVTSALVECGKQTIFFAVFKKLMCAKKLLVSFFVENECLVFLCRLL